MTTGEFARIMRITKETLFHYDEIGLFQPELTQPNGYRYYSIYQTEILDTILLLKDRTDADKGKLIRRKQELQDESRKRSDKLQEALAVLNNELQKALGKEKDYQNKNIEEIIERSSKKEEWKNRQVGLLEEQRILTSQYMEISTKYKSLIQTLDEQWNKIHEAYFSKFSNLSTTIIISF